MDMPSPPEREREELFVKAPNFSKVKEVTNKGSLSIISQCLIRVFTNCFSKPDYPFKTYTLDGYMVTSTNQLLVHRPGINLLVINLYHTCPN